MSRLKKGATYCARRPESSCRPKRVSSWPSTVSTQSISWCGDEMSAGSSAALASVGAAVLAAADAALLDDDEVAL